MSAEWGVRRNHGDVGSVAGPRDLYAEDEARDATRDTAHKAYREALAVGLTLWDGIDAAAFAAAARVRAETAALILTLCEEYDDRASYAQQCGDSALLDLISDIRRALGVAA